MSKVGRNSPCPCGSGKKYKKCCGKHGAILAPVHLEQQLEALKNDLFAFAKNKYQTALRKIIDQDLEAYMTNTSQQDKDNYANLAYPWYLFNEPITEAKETVFALFAKENITKIKDDRVKKAFLSWDNTLSFVYEVVAVPKRDEIVVRDITTDVTYPVILPNTNPSHVGKFLMGTLIPFIATHQFLHITALFPEGARENIEEVLKDFDYSSATVHKVFPEFVAHFYGAKEEATIEWKDDAYEDIADELHKRLVEKNRKDEAINYMLTFWHYYSTKHMPRVSKKQTYIATLDYVTTKMFYEDEQVTQTMVAKEYGVSAGTISNHYQKMLAETEAFSQEL